MSDVVWQALIAAFLAAYLEWSRRKAEKAVGEARRSAAEAATASTEAAKKAKAVESKLDVNTAATLSIDRKTDTVVDQTNGALDQMKALVTKIADRVDAVESYNHSTAHRVLDAINAVNLKIVEISAMQAARNSTVPTSRIGGES